jgi:hypothetical protein
MQIRAVYRMFTWGSLGVHIFSLVGVESPIDLID